jgi:hypothetical protein
LALRIIKLALISFVFFFLLLTAISLFIPSHVRISKAINVAATPSTLLGYIGDTTKWKEWHPLMQHALHQGTQQLLAQQLERTDSTIIFKTTYSNHLPSTNGWQVYQFPAADSITLQWYMDVHLKWYPWQKFGSLFYENTYGTVMQQGLENLRQLPIQ